MSTTHEGKARPRVVILGAGFAGAQVARGLRASNADVTLVDRENYHLFQPLLYQVATAALSPANIAEPIRRMLRGVANLSVVLDEVIGISPGERRVMLAGSTPLTYDYLVVATGATHTYFGHDDWERFAPSLKSIADARRIRSRLLLSFEQAEKIRDPLEQKRLMTFVVVGGGPSGVELAGAIAELARYTLVKDFRHIDSTSATVLLLEAGPRLLPAFPEVLAEYARRALHKLGVSVRENCPVKNIAHDHVETANGNLPMGFAIWAAGVQASPLAKALGVPTDRTGRIQANADLSVPGLFNVYALGDIARIEDARGVALPGLGQVAKQQGQYLGQSLARRIHDGTSSPPFQFRNRGNVAIIGRHAAVADFGWARLTGSSAWLLWAVVHIYLLVGFQHRLLVAMQWMWRYLTYDRGARLIVETDSEDKTC